jgi:hypothetical protein
MHDTTGTIPGLKWKVWNAKKHLGVGAGEEEPTE